MSLKRESEEHVVHVLTSIETIAKRDGVNYIEACVIYCDENSIEDIEGVAKILKANPKFMQKIRRDAEDLNFIKRSSSRENSNSIFTDNEV